MVKSQIMSDRSPAIEISGISKEYTLGRSTASLRESISSLFRKKEKVDSFLALNGIDFSVDRGERIGIIGKNGAGKSTLLKILSRITQPTEGEVKIYGSVASLLEVGTGFHPELTGRENIFLNGSILGMTRKEIQAKLDEIITFSGVEKFLDTPVKRYSSGMYVRLAFSVAAHLEPEILIVDEVLSVGDAEFQRKCLGKMDSVAKAGRTVLFVSHNLDAVRKMCDRCVWLEAGKVRMDGSAEEVVNAYLSDIELRSEEVHPSERMDRNGTGDVRIHDVKISNPDSDLIESGRPFEVSVEYQSASADTFHCLAAVGVYKEDGTRIGTLSTRFKDELVELRNGSKLTFKVERLPLAPGKYYLNSFIGHRTEQEVLDFVERVRSFEVHASRFFSESDEIYYPYDTVYFDHKFSLE